MRKKLKQQKGETLVESLVALLIATLSVMMLTAAITGSARVNKQNRDSDKSYAGDLKKVESYDSTPGNMVETGLVFDFNDGSPIEIIVELYGGTGKLASYKAKEDSGT